MSSLRKGTCLWLAVPYSSMPGLVGQFSLFSLTNLQLAEPFGHDFVRLCLLSRQSSGRQGRLVTISFNHAIYFIQSCQLSCGLLAQILPIPALLPNAADYPLTSLALAFQIMAFSANLPSFVSAQQIFRCARAGNHRVTL